MGDEGGGSRREELQVQSGHTIEEAFSGTERYRCDVGAQFVDESDSKVLVDRCRAAGDRDVAVAGGRTRLRERGLDAVGDEGEGGAARHRQWLARVVGEHEDWGVIGGLVAPPALPVQVPLSTDRSEHVAPHDEGAGRYDPVQFGLVLVGRFEHPGVQSVDRAVAEGLLAALVGSGEVPVDRDRDVAYDVVAHGSSVSLSEPGSGSSRPGRLRLPGSSVPPRAGSLPRFGLLVRVVAVRWSGYLVRRVRLRPAPARRPPGPGPRRCRGSRQRSTSRPTPPTGCRRRWPPSFPPTARSAR